MRPEQLKALATIVNLYADSLTLNEMQILSEIFSAMHKAMDAAYGYRIDCETHDDNTARFHVKAHEQMIATARTHLNRLEK